MALDIEEWLLDAGLHPVAVVADVRDALAHKAESCVYQAIIDADLGAATMCSPQHATSKAFPPSSSTPMEEMGAIRKAKWSG